MSRRIFYRLSNQDLVFSRNSLLFFSFLSYNFFHNTSPYSDGLVYSIVQLLSRAIGTGAWYLICTDGVRFMLKLNSRRREEGRCESSLIECFFWDTTVFTNGEAVGKAFRPSLARHRIKIFLRHLGTIT